MSYYTGLILADSPIAYYPLSDKAGSSTLADLSGNNNTGTLNGSGTTLGISGLVSGDTAATFNGSGWIVATVPTMPTGSAPWSVEAWINLPAIQTFLEIAVVIGTWGVSKETGFVAIDSTGHPQVGTNGFNHSETTVRSPNTTYHLVGTYDGANMALWVNGTQVVNVAQAMILTGTSLVIANAQTGSIHDQLVGTIQHVAAYNYTLTPQQIGAHYNARLGPTNYYAQINGVQANLVAGSLSVQNQIGQRSTGSIQVWSAPGVTWQYGTRVQVYDTTNTLVYSGYTTKDKATKGGARLGQGYLEHSLSLMDNAYKADKRIIFYSNTNASAGQIVQDLVNKVLYQEGVTYTAQSVAMGPTIPEVVWNGKTISDCLDFLSKQAGYWWNIDVNSVLWFQPYGGVPAPFILDGTQVDAGTVGGLSVEFGNDQYINTQYTKGGNAEVGKKTAPLDETFHGNGVTRSFTLSYPVSSLYNVILNGVDVTAHSLTKGSGGGQWYYAPGDAVIAQDTAQTVLGSGDTLEVKYAGRVPAIGKASNATLIATQKAREGGNTSGIVESVYSDTKVHTLPAALQIASALLAHYGSDTTVLEFDTRSKGLAEGQMLTVNLPDFNLSNKQMLVSSVTISDQVDGFNIWYHVQCVGSPYETAQWQTYWQSLMNQQADPSDLSDVNDTQLTPIVTSTFSHSPLFSIGGFKTSCPICGPATLCGPTTIVC